MPGTAAFERSEICYIYISVGYLRWMTEDSNSPEPWNTRGPGPWIDMKSETKKKVANGTRETHRRDDGEQAFFFFFRVPRAFGNPNDSFRFL